jgi:rubredoxin
MGQLTDILNGIQSLGENDLYYKARSGGVEFSYLKCPLCGYVSGHELGSLELPCPSCGSVGFERIPSDWPEGPGVISASSLLLGNVSKFFELAYDTTQKSYEAYASELSENYGVAFSKFDLLALLDELEKDNVENKGGNAALIIRTRLQKDDINLVQILADLTFRIDYANIYDKAVVIFSIMVFETYYDAILSELFEFKGYDLDFIDKKINDTRWNTGKREECLKCLAGYGLSEYCSKNGIGIFTGELKHVQKTRNELIHAKRYSAYREESVRALKFAYMVPAVFAAIYNDRVTRNKASR